MLDVARLRSLPDRNKQLTTIEVALDTDQGHKTMKKLSYIILAMASMILTSCSGEFWQGFAEGGLALLTSAAYMPSTPSAGSGSLDYLLDPNYAIAQAKQEMYNEWYQATGGGKTMSYDQYLTARAQAASQASSGSTSSTSSSSSSRKKASASSSLHECSLCNGSGMIIRESHVATFGLDSKKYCSTCDQTFMASTGHMHVSCSQCHGKGYF